jgi:hypothetical protein
VSFCTLYGFRPFRISPLECMAGTTGLEPATSAVTDSIKCGLGRGLREQRN